MAGPWAPVSVGHLPTMAQSGLHAPAGRVHPTIHDNREISNVADYLRLAGSEILA